MSNLEKLKLTQYGFDVLQIESTAACNMACSFCPYPLKDDKVSKLELKIFLTLLKVLTLKTKILRRYFFSI